MISLVEEGRIGYDVFDQLNEIRMKVKFLEDRFSLTHQQAGQEYIPLQPAEQEPSGQEQLSELHFQMHTERLEHEKQIQNEKAAHRLQMYEEWLEQDKQRRKLDEELQQRRADILNALHKRTRKIELSKVAIRRFRARPTTAKQHQALQAAQEALDLSKNEET